MFKVFYVLRKKERQISFLHVYHHIGVLTASWVSGKYFPGGQAIYVALYNTLIHCIMYVYYLLSAWNPNYSKDIWWKKYVTLLQIVSWKIFHNCGFNNLKIKCHCYCSQVQHCLVFISMLPAVVNVNCTYPKGWAALLIINVGFIIYLFARFYKNTYLSKKKNK
jgi:hypothetical protein